MNKYEFELNRQRLEIWQVLISRLSKWVPICFICYFGYLSITALAGRTTLAQLQMWALADLKMNKALSHVVMATFGIGGASYGAVERGLRRRSIKRLGDQIKRLEETIDRRRSSSRLTREGKTRPEDRI